MSFVLQPQSLFAIGPSRSFGSKDYFFSGYVTITENAVDELEITKQPVQQGATVTDHAFAKPTRLAIQMLFQSGLFSDSLSQIYQNLLNLQQSMVPFDCITPKRTYKNMLFASLSQTTDKKTENCLAINASFEQIIIVPIQTTNVPRGQLSNPGNNGGTQNVGSKNLTSGLATLLGGK